MENSLIKLLVEIIGLLSDIVRIFRFVHFQPDIFLDAYLFTFIKLIINSLVRYLAYIIVGQKKGEERALRYHAIVGCDLAMCVNSLLLMANSVAGYSLIASWSRCLRSTWIPFLSLVADLIKRIRDKTRQDQVGSGSQRISLGKPTCARACTCFTNFILLSTSASAHVIQPLTPCKIALVPARTSRWKRTSR